MNDLILYTFSSISVISGRWIGNNERLCATCRWLAILHPFQQYFSQIRMMIMKGCMQWNLVWDWKDICLKLNLNSGSVGYWFRVQVPPHATYFRPALKLLSIGAPLCTTETCLQLRRFLPPVGITPVQFLRKGKEQLFVSPAKQNQDMYFRCCRGCCKLLWSFCM